MKEMQIQMIREDCKQSCTDHKLLMPLKDQKILITGGTGFVGKWICEMICFLNTTYNFNIHLYLLGRDIELFSNTFPHLSKQKFIKLIEQDIRNLHDLPMDTEWVINAAASPDSRLHASQPLRTIDTIYRGTSLILDHCFRLPVLKKVLHLSSNQVYGKIQGAELISEEMIGKLDANKFSNIYAEAKRISESICAIYRNQNRLPIVICRPFAFIGPYQNLDKPWAINNFIRDALIGGPIRILGNENTVRSYLYASDMAFWLLATLVNGKTGEVYNIGCSEKITLDELANKIKRILSLKTNNEIKSSKNEYSVNSSFLPDLTKIKKDMNVKETFNIDLALDRTINWYKISN